MNVYTSSILEPAWFIAMAGALLALMGLGFWQLWKAYSDSARRIDRHRRNAASCVLRLTIVPNGEAMKNNKAGQTPLMLLRHFGTRSNNHAIR